MVARKFPDYVISCDYDWTDPQMLENANTLRLLPKMFLTPSPSRSTSKLMWLMHLKVFDKFLLSSRSSHRKYSIRKGALKNFKKFTGKRLCQSLFLPAALLKKRLLHRCFPVNGRLLIKLFKFSETVVYRNICVSIDHTETKSDRMMPR